MLMASRKEFELLTTQPGYGIDPQLTLGELVAQGPIGITIFNSRETGVTVGVDAQRQLSISHHDCLTV